MAAAKAVADNCNGFFHVQRSKMGCIQMDNHVRTYRKHQSGKISFRSLALEHGIEVVDVSRQRDMAMQNITYKALVDSQSDVSLPKGKMLLFTFRADSTIERSQNVFFEIEHTKRNGRKEDGWYFTCSADYIVYYNAANNSAIILDWNKVREQIDDGKMGKIKYIVNDGDECMTKVCLATIDELNNQGCVVCKL